MSHLIRNHAYESMEELDSLPEGARKDTSLIEEDTNTKLSVVVQLLKGMAQAFVETDLEEERGSQMAMILLAEIKELTDTFDLLTEREISQIQVNLRKKLGAYDDMVVLATPHIH